MSISSSVRFVPTWVPKSDPPNPREQPFDSAARYEISRKLGGSGKHLSDETKVALNKLLALVNAQPRQPAEPFSAPLYYLQGDARLTGAQFFANVRDAFDNAHDIAFPTPEDPPAGPELASAARDFLQAVVQDVMSA